MLSQNLKYNDLELRPLHPSHREELRLNAKNDKIWTYNTQINKYSDELYNSWFTTMYNNYLFGSEIPFVLFLKDNAIGTTRYYSIKTDLKEISIGFTWITPNYWQTGVNRKMKLLIMENAFNHGFEKLFFHVDNLNSRSLLAMKKLGAIENKITPQNRMRVDGSFRDTVEFLVNKEIFLDFKSTFTT
jgi:RimJ/RimL family protein N-acetyltransferase